MTTWISAAVKGGPMYDFGVHTEVQRMVRRTISLPEAIDELVRDVAKEEGSYSAAVARLVEQAARIRGRRRVPSYVGSASGGPPDLGRNYEKYLRQLIRSSARRR